MEAAKQLNFFDTQINEMQRQFLDVMYHDAKDRKGYFFKASYRPFVREKWTTSIDNLAANIEEADTYVSINSFHGKSRNASNIHTINNLYFDLDFHEICSENELKERIDNMLKAINLAVEDGKLPCPTMITKSGRGLGLFFVLEKSIANTSNTKKAIRFWEHIAKIWGKSLKTLL